MDASSHTPCLLLKPLVLVVFSLCLFLPEVHAERLVFRFDSEESLGLFVSGQSPLASLLKPFEPKNPLPFHSAASFLTRSIFEINFPTQSTLGTQAHKLLSAIHKSEGVAWSERVPVRHCDLQPNDALLADLWALGRVQAFAAWDEHIGSPQALVAIVDTGVDSQHPDLQEALWLNPLEMAGSAGVDDDGNGWVDDVQGWDFVDNDALPDPESGDQSHGTHVAGTIGAWTNNATGVASIAWRTSLLAVRAGHGSLIHHGVEGLWYAATTGAHVINCSWGGSSFSHYESDVIQAAQNLGSLVVASAGNNGHDAEHYPGAYEGVLCVAASTPDDTKMSGSQYGWWVDVSAPGSNILSTVMGGGYAQKSGTSMSTPEVASLCALILDAHPQYSAQQVREHLCFTADNIDAQNPSHAGLLGHGRINAWRAMTESPRATGLASYTLDDADADESPEPGEEISLLVELASLLGDFNAMTLTLSSPLGGLEEIDMQTTFSSLTEGDQQSHEADPFLFRLSSDLEPGYRMRLELTVTAADFEQTHHLHFTVSPMWATLAEGEVVLSLTDNGAIGAYDFESMTQLGEGLRWPASSANHLYASSFLLALADGRVASQASYLTGVGGDFEVLPGGEIHFRMADGLKHVEASFAWVGEDAPDGIVVDLHAVASASMPHAVFVTYTLRNTGNSDLVACVPGLWMDLDVGGAWSDDEGGLFESVLFWQKQTGASHIGVALLDEPLASFRLCTWGEWSPGGLEDDELNEWMREGFVQTESTGSSDYQACLAASALDLLAGESHSFSFVIVGADDLATLELSHDAAVDFWESVGVEEGTSSQAQAFMLATLAPNPFNPRTLLNIELKQAASLQTRLYDVMGRLLQEHEHRLPAGSSRVSLDLSGMASGPYYLQVQAGGEQVVLLMTKLK
jgi:serine protease